MREVRNVPRPIQPGGPPIMIGGGGEKRTLRIVARHADMCNVFGDVAGIRNKLAILRSHCEEIGRDPSEITASRLATLILTDDDAQTAAAREMLVKAAGAESARAFNVGTDSEIAAQIAELVEAGTEYFIFNMPLSDPAGIRRAGAIFAGL